MEKEKLNRINELARKSRTEALSDEERTEQKLLREEYIAEFRTQFRDTLEHTVIQDPDGSKEPLPTYMKSRKEKEKG